MTQRFYYFSPQTPGANRWTVDLGTSAIRLGDIPGWATAAENGDVASNGVAIDDPTGSAGYFGDAILGLKTFYVTESDCATYGSDGVNGIRLWTGYIRERRYRRGDSTSPSLLTGAARRIDIGLEDLNSLATFRIIGNTSGLGYTVLTGTVSKAGSTTITGSGTVFQTELAVGSTISVPGGGGTDILYVASIASNTSLTTTSAAAYTASGQTARRLDGARPAETDVQRVKWLLSGIPAFLPVTNDAGWVDTSGPVNMDANDYTGAPPSDVIHDCATASGKDWWIGYWEATGTDSLWYRDSTTATVYTSNLSLSDVLTDLTFDANGQVVGSVFPYMPDAELLRDPTFTFAGLYEPYANGYVIAQNASTANTYAWRDGTAPNSNVKTAAKANAIATRLLNQDSAEQDRITCRVQLPSTLATGIKAGQRLQFRSSFMPGYDPARWMRVRRCTVAQDEETDKRYTVSLELTPQIIECVPSIAHRAPPTGDPIQIISTPLNLGNFTPSNVGDLLLLFGLNCQYAPVFGAITSNMPTQISLASPGTDVPYTAVASADRLATQVPGTGASSAVFSRRAQSWDGTGTGWYTGQNSVGGWMLLDLGCATQVVDFSTANGVGTTAAAGSVSTTNTGMILLAVTPVMNQVFTVTAPAGYTTIYNGYQNGTNYFCLFYKNVTGPTTENPAATLSLTRDWCAIVLAVQG